MRRRALRLCPCTACSAHPGNCPQMTTGGRCPACSATYEQHRGTRQQRGYDAAYDAARERWRPKVEAGRVHCHADVCIEESGRLILAHQPWDLGHDGPRIRGPEHASCNRSAGGKAAHRTETR